MPIPANPKLRELSNAVNFRVLPQLSAVSPPRGLPGTVVRFLGSGLSPGANVRFADRVFPTTLNAAGAPQVTLPDFDTIGMSAGPLRSILARDHRECRADEICDRGTLTFDCP